MRGLVSNLAALLGGKAVKHVFQFFANGTKKGLLSVFWSKHHMIFAFPRAVI
jgi:hypothetical protein